MFAFLLASVTFLQMWGSGHMRSGWGWNGWLAMAFGMALFWGAIAGGMVWLLRTTHFRGPQSTSALDIARERYARGEISHEEFERIKRGLK